MGGAVLYSKQVANHRWVGNKYPTTGGLGKERCCQEEERRGEVGGAVLYSKQVPNHRWVGKNGLAEFGRFGPRNKLLRRFGGLQKKIVEIDALAATFWAKTDFLKIPKKPVL